MTIVDAGDYVVVSDALKAVFTGKKATDKVYYHHTGYPGGLKTVPVGRMRERRPEDVSQSQCYVELTLQIIKKAVSGMLPKNTFRKRRLERLRVYPGPAPPDDMANALTTWRDLQPSDPQRTVAL